MLNLLKNDKRSFVFLTASILLSILGLIFYIVSQNLMQTKLSPWILTVSILGVLLIAFVVLYKDFNSSLLIAASALTFLAFVLVVSSQMGNLGYYFAGIKDIGYGLMPTFFVSAIAYLASIVLTSIEVFIKKN